MSLQSVIAQMQTYMLTLDNVLAAPDKPPEQMHLFPFVVTFARRGTWKLAPAETKTGLHTIHIEVHVARVDLPYDVQAAMQYSDSVPELLMSKLLNDNQWNDTIDTFGDIDYEFGVLGWAKINTLGFRFIVKDVKVQTPIT